MINNYQWSAGYQAPYRGQTSWYPWYSYTYSSTAGTPSWYNWFSSSSAYSNTYCEEWATNNSINGIIPK